MSRKFQLALVVACVVSMPLSGVAQEVRTAAANTKAKGNSRADALFADAGNIQNKGEYALAIDQWTTFLKRYPDDDKASEARHYRGVCLLQLQKFEQAAKDFQQVIEDTPDFQFVEDSYVNLGWSQYSLGIAGDAQMFESAAHTLNEFRRQHAGSKLMDQALFYLGESHYLQGKRDEAIQYYKALVRDHGASPLAPDAYYALGVAYQEQREPAEAEKVYDKFLARFPKHDLAPEILTRKGETLISRRQYRAAEEILTKASADPQSPLADYAAFRRAHAVARQERYEDAAKLFGAITQDHSQSQFVGPAIIAAGRNLYQAKKYDAAKSWLAKVTDVKSPLFKERAHWHSRIALAQKQPEQALKIASAAVSGAQDPNVAAVLRLDIADAMYAIPDKRAESLPAYEKIYAEYPQTPTAAEALYNASYAALDLKKFDKSVALASQFSDEFPDHRLLPDASYVAAESKFLAGDYPAAFDRFARLISTHANHQDVEAWKIRRGLSLMLQEKYDAATEQLTADLLALKNPASRAEALFLIGSSHVAKEKYAEAATAFNASLEASPKWHKADEVALALANVQRKMGNLDEALATSQRLVDKPNPKVKDKALFEVAEAAYQAGDYATAVKNYGHLVDNFPTSKLVPKALYGKAWSEFKVGQPKASVASVDTLITKFPEHDLIPDAYRTRAMSRQAIRDYNGAIADITTFLESKPERTERHDGLYIRGLSEVGLQQNEQAIKTFTEIIEADPEYKRGDRVLYELAWALRSTNKTKPAIQAFDQLWKRFPESNLAAEAAYHIGEDHYRARKFEPAITLYENVIKKSPRPDLAEKAYYKLGWANFQIGNYDAAHKRFAQQVENFPDGHLVHDGKFMVGESLFKKKNYQEAFAAFQEVRADGKLEGTSQLVAMLHGGQAAAQINDYETSAKWLAEVTAKHGDSTYAVLAQYEEARARQHMKQWAQAQELYEQVIEKSRSATGARARFMLGEIHFGQKKIDDALKQFQLLVLGYGGDKAPPEIKKWQVKGALEAGRCAAIKAGELNGTERTAMIARARKYFQLVIQQHAGTEEASAAEQQLKKLGT